MAVSKKRKVLIGALVFVALCVVVVAVVAGVLIHRNQSPFVAVPGAKVDYESGDIPEGAVPIAYTSEVLTSSSDGGRTCTYAYFDDAWFDADGRTYNHELATTAMILSAVANSESQYYGDAVKDAPSYIEDAFTSFGFTDIDTSSYADSSTARQEIGKLAEGTEDTVAYAMASKQLEDGYTLVAVVVRGSFGSEWVSDARIEDSVWSEVSYDHTGYLLASMDVENALDSYIGEHGLSSDNTKLLICGHSRGGSVANLVAKTCIDIMGTEGAPVSAENLFAYTFAASACTTNPDAGGEAYASIFNVVNPADIVPKLPLAAWGYTLYGTKLLLPDSYDDGFTEAYEAMQEARAANTGYLNGDPDVAGEPFMADVVVDKIASEVPDTASLTTAGGIVDVVKDLASEDLYRILVAHFPDTYIAWMQSLDPLEA